MKMVMLMALSAFVGAIIHALLARSPRDSGEEAARLQAYRDRADYFRREADYAKRKVMDLRMRVAQLEEGAEAASVPDPTAVLSVAQLPMVVCRRPPYKAAIPPLTTLYLGPRTTPEG